jgi:hypothetical protein
MRKVFGSVGVMLGVMGWACVPLPGKITAPVAAARRAKYAMTP